MYVAGWLHFSTLEKWFFIGDVLCVPAVHSPPVLQGPGASWSQSSVWPAFVGLLCRLRNCSFLASGVCPRLGEAGLEACTGLMMRRRKNRVWRKDGLNLEWLWISWWNYLLGRWKYGIHSYRFGSCGEGWAHLTKMYRRKNIPSFNRVKAVWCTKVSFANSCLPILP